MNEKMLSFLDLLKTTSIVCVYVSDSCLFVKSNDSINLFDLVKSYNNLSKLC